MSLTRECPVCHRVNRPGARTCEGCGWNFDLNRPGKAGRDPGAGEDRPGVFGLALGTIVHPIATMDAFFYYVSDTAMLGKMALFYLVSLPITGFIVAGGDAGHWAQGTAAEAVGFAVSLVCIVGAGRLLGQSGGLLGAAVILGFVRAVVTFVLGIYVLAIVTGLMPFSLVVLLVFKLWIVVLNVVALTNIFGCSAIVAFFISFIAGFLERLVITALAVAS